MPLTVNRHASIPLPLAWIAVAWLLVAVTACGAETSRPATRVRGSRAGGNASWAAMMGRDRHLSIGLIGLHDARCC